jgi:hypothetical protein
MAAQRAMPLPAGVSFSGGNLVGNLVDPLLQLVFRTVVDLFFAETVTRIVHFKLGFELSPFGVKTIEISVAHEPT